MIYRICTNYPVNIRKHPGTIFDVVKRVPVNTTYESYEQKKDGAGTLWYNTSDGWICGRFVSLAPDFAYDIKEGNPVKSTSTIRSAEGEDEGSTETVSDPSSIEENTATLDGNGLGMDEEDEEATGMDEILARRAFGYPYQFLSTTDARGVGSDAELGIELLETMREAPVISVLPGKPHFLADVSDDKRKGLIDVMSSVLEGEKSIGRRFADQFLDTANMDTPYFSFEMDAVEYAGYVNTLCWSIASFLGIGTKEVPGTGKIYSTFNYFRYTLANRYAARAANNPGYAIGKWPNEVISRAFSDVFTSPNDFSTTITNDVLSVFDEMDASPWYTDFYIDPSVSYSESFGNGTGESIISNMVKGASDFSKEIGFLTAAGGMTADLQASQENLGKSIKEAGSGLLDGGGVIQRLLSGATSVISGTNLVFPELWKTSNFNRSYSISIHLKSAYGTKESIFTDIIVPMCFWIALAAPRQATANTFKAPFLTRFFIPGFCSVDMGIVESLQISKGGNGDAWSVDGLPLQVDLNISIKDLYSSLFMSRLHGINVTDALNFSFNSAFLDYLGVQGGLDMRKFSGIQKGVLALYLINGEISTNGVFGGGSWLERVGQTLTTARMNLMRPIMKLFS